MARFFVTDDGILGAMHLVPGSIDNAIAKWEFIAEHPEIRYGYASETCSLCIEFYDTCEGCPICEYTGEDECHGTPFYLYRRAHSDEDKVLYAKEMVSLLEEVAKVSGRDCAEGSGQLEGDGAGK